MEKVKFKEEKYIDIKEEMAPLLYEHWKAIALYQDKIPLDPNHEQYISANDAGLIKIYTARKNEELVGYFVLQIYHHMHYNSNKFALCDVIYVKPEHRAGGTGPKLIKYCEERMKELDVEVIAINTKAHALFDKLLEKMDYQLADLFYSKWIGK